MPIVYSTKDGQLCPGCEKPAAQCICQQTRREAVPIGDGVVRVSRETKGRKGKGVTLVTGLLLNQNDLEELARQLKRRCGTGGTVKDGVIEIQGDHRQTLAAELMKRGYRVKLAGG